MGHKIRTTIQPDVEIEVEGPELLDLQRQGLVLNTRATTPDGARRAAEKQAEAPAKPDTTKEN